jgi:hypothetical protein
LSIWRARVSDRLFADVEATHAALDWEAPRYRHFILPEQLVTFNQLGRTSPGSATLASLPAFGDILSGTGRERFEEYWCLVKHARRVLGVHPRYRGEVA